MRAGRARRELREIDPWTPTVLRVVPAGEELMPGLYADCEGDAGEMAREVRDWWVVVAEPVRPWRLVRR